MTATPADAMTAQGANALAARIREFWQARGYHGIETRVVSVDRCRSQSRPEVEIIYCVRSNIGPNGFPPKGGRS
jgi:hypothetical protein